MSSIYACDFSDISDGEIVTATQLLEDSITPDAQDVGPLFCDISDYDLVSFASQAELTSCDLTSKDSLCNFPGVIHDENIKPQIDHSLICINIFVMFIVLVSEARGYGTTARPGLRRLSDCHVPCVAHSDQECTARTHGT